ncbi:MAG: Holliday junction resolvase RuvX [Candidatus Gracilibacteria bacterium]
MGEKPGRILALDYGLKRIGMAVTDFDRTMVFPRPVLENKGHGAVVEFLRVFCRDEQVSLIVLGCPYDDAHVENEQTDKVRLFGEKVREALGIEVMYEDEKYTTAESEALLDEFGLDFGEKKSRRDGVAAMLILQSYLKKV